MADAPLLGTGGIAVLALYLVGLLFIGWLGRRAQKEQTLADFYLAGRGIGVFVLFLTLYATQYSGNTLIGFAGRTYRQGYQALSLLMLMMIVIGAFAIFAPKLYRLSQQRRYLTISDYVHDRFGSTALTVSVSLACIVALGNYILTNLKAIGFIVEASTGGRIGFAEGVIVLAIIMVIYETLGGLRSVAWTDVIQGILLLIGCACIFVAIQVEYGGLRTLAPELQTLRPDFWLPPDADAKRSWLSTILLSAFAISMYPHAIQRIYAARSARTLRRSLQWMAFMPLVTTFFIIIVGLIAVVQFPELSRVESEEVTLLVLNDLAARVPALSIVLIVFLCAAIAAIMSTVDSALLALSALFTQDLYRRMRPGQSQKHLTQVGKLFSWAAMIVCVYLALTVPETIWRIIEIKLELLCQVAPAVFLGLHVKRLSTRGVLIGFLLGTGLAVGFMLLGGTWLPSRPLGIHAGLWGLMLNVLTIGVFTWVERPRP
ncbi:MAG: sodium:solute symporter [Rhodothermales bacterium]